MNDVTITFRCSAAESAWLKVRSKENGRSLNAEIRAAIREAMRHDPLEIVVHEIAIPGAPLYAVSVGEWGDDFHEGHSKSEAIAVAHAKAKEIGSSLADVRFKRMEVIGIETTDAKVA